MKKCWPNFRGPVGVVVFGLVYFSNVDGGRGGAYFPTQLPAHSHSRFQAIPSSVRSSREQRHRSLRTLSSPSRWNDV